MIDEVEAYFDKQGIKVIKSLNTGTSMKFTTSEGIFVLTYEKRFFKLLPGNGIKEIQIKKPQSAATDRGND